MFVKKEVQKYDCRLNDERQQTNVNSKIQVRDERKNLEVKEREFAIEVLL
jgi:hypothetical protein